MADIKFDITKSIGVLSGNAQTGWTKEINLVSWNERDAKFDLRDWNEEHDRMRKGITMTKEEVIKLKEILNSVDLENL